MKENVEDPSLSIALNKS